MMRSGHHDTKFYKDMWDTIKESGLWEGQLWNRSKTGKVFPVLVTISKLQNLADQKTYYIATSSDITHLKMNDTAKLNLALYDLLTILPNKLAIEDFFQRTRQNYAEAKIALMIIDVENFKSVNDLYGYLAGDKLLKHISHKLQAIIRNPDLLGRLDKDAFIIVLPNLLLQEQIDDYRRFINDIFNAAFSIDDIDIYVKCSIKVIISTKPSDNFDNLMAASNP